MRKLLRRFRLRARYFLRAEKVPKDALRGARAGWDLRLRCAPGGDPYAPPPPRPPPFTGANTRTLALAAGAQGLAAVPLLRRPLRPGSADETPSALVRRCLGVRVDGVGRRRRAAAPRGSGRRGVPPPRKAAGASPRPTCCGFTRACPESKPHTAGRPHGAAPTRFFRTHPPPFFGIGGSAPYDPQGGLGRSSGAP